MSRTDRDTLEKALDLVLEARDLLGTVATSQNRLLIDVLLLELGRQLAAADRTAGGGGTAAD